MKTMQANPIPSKNFDHFYATFMSLFKKDMQLLKQKNIAFQKHTPNHMPLNWSLSGWTA